MGITLPQTTTNFADVPMNLARDIFTGVGTPVVEEVGDLLMSGLKTIAPK